MSKRGHGQLFKNEFEPIAQIGDVVALTQPGGFVTEDAETPFYAVTHVEAVPVFGQKGVVVIFSTTAAPALPYQADANCQTGQQLAATIASGAQMSPLQPAFLQLQARQIMQFRTLVRALADSDGDALTGVIDDYDVTLSVPQSTQRMRSSRLGGVLNASAQKSLPSDVVAAPAQGTNFAASTDTQHDVFEGMAARSELFVYGDKAQASVTVQNNGSATASDGAIGLQVSGFILNLYPIERGDAAMSRTFLGYSVPVPSDVALSDVIVIPAAGQSLPKGLGK